MAANVHVILARDVPNLGRVGDLAQVRPGYARNFLIPQGLALPASPKRVSEFEHKKRVIEHKRRVLRAGSEKRAEELSKVQVTLTAKVGEQGKLFGSITNRDIAGALKAEGHNIHHRDIKLEAPIKSIGLHLVDLRLEADVTAQVKVVIAAAEPSAEEAEEAAEAAPDYDDDDADYDAEDVDADESPAEA